MQNDRNISRRFIGLVLLVVVLAGWLWWRMGGIVVEENATDLKVLPDAETVQFSIMTYNVQARPWFDETRHKFPLISPLLNKYDVCAIQECFKDYGRLWAQAEHPVKVYHATLRHPFKIVGSGLSILGKFPLIRTGGVNFIEQGDAQNRPASKGVLLAYFDIQGMPVDVYTTHIAAGKKEASLRARITQGDELMAFIRENSPPEHAVILLGDFNMRPSRGPEDKEQNKNNPRVVGFDRIVVGLALRDASDEINGPIGTEIDRILFRPGAGHVMEVLNWQHDTPEFYDPDGAPLSDHEPVIVTFRLALAS